MSEKCVWANCVDWLERCGVLSPQQASTIDSMQQLASFMRDGVLLCHLANKIHPNAIDLRDFSQKPKNSQFLCKKNVDAFLHAAKHIFGVKDKDLFTSTEILEMTNFGKVLVTLSKLSELESVKKQQIRPFSIEMDAIYVIMENKIEDEIYSITSLYDTKLSAIYDSEQIYDTLVIRKPSVRASNISKSDRCIEELIDTEKNYLTVLNDIKSKFQDKLSNHITKNQDRQIFFNIENIINLHGRFYAELLANKNSPSSLPSCFITNKMDFTLYGDYCAHLPTAVNQIPLLCKCNPIASEIINNANIEVQVKLHDIITMPFQRFFKYPLLLKEIIKNLSNEGGCDTGIIDKWKEALDCFEDLALYINELTGGKEALLEMETIANSFEGGLKMGQGCQLTDYGRRLFDGEFNYKPPKGRTFEVRHIFLFEKLILLCKPIKKNLFKYTEFILVRKSSVYIEAADKEKLLFLTNNKLEYVFKSRKEDNLYKLEEFIHLAKENIDPAGADSKGFNFVLTNFDGPKSCDICKHLLRGAISQGYKCQISGKSVHKECILLATDSVSFKRGDLVIATSDYTGQPKFGHNTSLIFSKDDVIQLMRTNSGVWLQGELKGKVGYFPLSKIKLLKSSKGIKPGYEEHEIKSTPKSDNVNKPVPPPPPNPVSDLNSYPWYIERLNDVDDNYLVDKCLDGTFYVRKSTKDKSYTIVLKYLKMRKLQVKQSDDLYYEMAGDTRSFPSIIELVEFYKNNSLSEIYSQIETTLKHPYKEKDSLLTCIAKYDFIATQPNHLSIEKGDVIQVFSKPMKIWWQGNLRNESGFFPRSYVE